MGMKLYAGEWFNGFFEELKVGEGDAKVVVDVCFVGGEGLVFEGFVEVLDAFLVPFDGG